MRNKKLTKEEISELKRYIKEQSKKLKNEGSTTAGVPGYHTPAAFTGNEDGEGAESFDYEDDQFAYSEKAPKTHKHSIKLHEVSYKAFKQDGTVSEIQKVNKKILEVNKMLREISRSLDHSIKLKQESAMDNSIYWKRTNEAILKINQRLAEVGKKARKLANLKELAATSVRDKLVQFFKRAGMSITPQDIEYNQVGTEHYEFDVYLNGEPYAIDYQNGQLTFQDYDQEVVLGSINQEADLIKNITQTFKA